MFKNKIKYILCSSLSFFLFNLSCFAFAQSETILDQNDALCDFNGFITGSSQWESVEFSSLLKDENMPGYYLMSAIIGKFYLGDKNILKSSTCKVSKYVTELLKYYDENKTIIRSKHKDIAELLDDIKEYLKDKEAFYENK